MLGKAALSASQLARLQASLPAWSVSATQLQREYRFHDDQQASDFVSLVTQLGCSHRAAALCDSRKNTVKVCVDAIGRHVSLAKFIDKAEAQVKVDPSTET